MSQRVALLVDGTNVELSRRGLQIDYGLLPAYVKGEAKRISRDVVVARVYLEPRVNSTPRWKKFVNGLSAMGYQVYVCKEEAGTRKTAVDRDIQHDMLVLALTGRVDIIALVSGDAGFARAIRTVQAHGVDVEVLGVGDAAADVLKREARFRDLTDTVLLKA